MSYRATITIGILVSITMVLLIAGVGYELHNALAFDWTSASETARAHLPSANLVQHCDGSGTAHDCRYEWTR